MATPALVQYAKFGGTSDGTTLRWWPLANPVLNGNAVIVCLQCSSGQTPTVSDDKNGSYSTAKFFDDSTNEQDAYVVYRLNVTDAPTKIKVTFPSTNGFLSDYVSEWQNIATSSVVDGTPQARTQTGTSVSPSGSAMTVTSDSLVITYVMQDAVDPYHTDQCISSWTVPTNFRLLAADRWTSETVAYWIATSTSSNPSWTLS